MELFGILRVINYVLVSQYYQESILLNVTNLIINVIEVINFKRNIVLCKI